MKRLQRIGVVGVIAALLLIRWGCEGSSPTILWMADALPLLLYTLLAVGAWVRSPRLACAMRHLERSRRGCAWLALLAWLHDWL